MERGLKNAVRFFMVFVIINCLIQNIQANPIDNELETTVASKSPEITIPTTDAPVLVPETELASDEEDMETANSMVFRPMFVYRRQQAQRRRIYEEEQKPVRRKDPEYYYPYGYPSYGYPYYRPIKRKKPVHKEPEFPALF